MVQSPPRMRGRERGSARKGAPSRITPAYAGKSKLPLLDYSPAWDHPRVCGEEAPVFLSLMARTGSPPRMRGRVMATLEQEIASGITPAYAGKSRRKARRNRGRRDHPRVCGEEPAPRQRAAFFRGSPPRMRGRDPSFSDRRHWHRITPAYAGKSYTQLFLATTARDHPRVCGEE